LRKKLGGRRFSCFLITRNWLYTGLFRRLGILDICSSFCNRVLRWAGNVARMPMSRAPRQLLTGLVSHSRTRTRTRTNTNPNRRSGNARALRKQSKCGMIQEGEGHWPNSSENLQKARYLSVLRTPQNNKEEGARARKLVTCGTRSPLGRGQSVPFSAQGAYCSAPEP